MSEFIEYLHEVFAQFGPITVRRMFDGHMIYHQGLPIGIVHDETLYLKADGESAAAFEAQELDQFSYRKQGKTILLPYFQAPESVLENRSEAALWGRRAFEAALRTQRPRKRS